MNIFDIRFLFLNISNFEILKLQLFNLKMLDLESNSKFKCFKCSKCSELSNHTHTKYFFVVEKFEFKPSDLNITVFRRIGHFVKTNNQKLIY